MATIELQLIKMNGIGNRFLIFDARKNISERLKEHVVAKIPDLSATTNAITGGCDQFLIIEQPYAAGSTTIADNVDVKMLIYNADGSRVGACGNATRCIVKLLADETGKQLINIVTDEAVLSGIVTDSSQGLCSDVSQVQVNMGQPIWDWQRIPLAREVDVMSLPISLQITRGDSLSSALTLKEPIAVSMGNPHMVFFTDVDIDGLDISSFAPALEEHSLYPERTNVEFSNIIDDYNIKLRVFERGVGETQACGTGACATFAAACRAGLISLQWQNSTGQSSPQEFVKIHLRGGILRLSYNQCGEILMQGVAEYNGKVMVYSQF